MIWGLLIVLAVMLVLFWIVKSFFKKKQVFTDIPGMGRLLGKADLDIRKSLFFL